MHAYLGRHGPSRFALALLAASMVGGCTSAESVDVDAGSVMGGSDAAREDSSSEADDAEVFEDAGPDDGRDSDVDSASQLEDSSADSGDPSVDDSGDPGTIEDAGEAIDALIDSGDGTDDASDDGGTDAGINEDAAVAMDLPCGLGSITAASPSGASVVVPSLGSLGSIAAVRRDGLRVAASARDNRLMLWALDTGRSILERDGTVVALAGGRLIAVASGQVVVISATEGQVLASIPLPASTTYGVDANATYVWLASSSSLTIVSSSGSVMVTRAGNYAGASLFAADGAVLIARGPAGSNVIETVPIDGSPVTTSVTFSGSFSNWFNDGTHFLSTVGQNAYVYTRGAQQVQLVPLVGFGTLGGAGRYFWNQRAYAFDLYQVGGSGQPLPLPYDGAERDRLMSTGRNLVIARLDSNGFYVSDLNAVPFASVPGDSSAPVRTLASDTTGEWCVGGDDGIVNCRGSDGSSTTLRRFGCGKLRGLQGSESGVFVLSTARGTFIADAVRGRLLHETSVGLAADLQMGGGVRIAADGQRVVGAVGDSNVTGATRSLYSLRAPTWSFEHEFSYSYAGSQPPALVSFDLSKSGNVLARTLRTRPDSTYVYTTIVSDVDGTNVRLSIESGPGKLSPSGAYFAVSDMANSSSTATRIYLGGDLTSAVPGKVLGWISDTELLLVNYVWSGGTYIIGSTSVYTADGAFVRTINTPVLYDFSMLRPNVALSRTNGRVYDLLNGGQIGTIVFPEGSTAAGDFVLSVAGQQIVSAPAP